MPRCIIYVSLLHVHIIILSFFYLCNIINTSVELWEVHVKMDV